VEPLTLARRDKITSGAGDLANAVETTNTNKADAWRLTARL